MAALHQIVCVILVSQVYVYAAPRDAEKVNTALDDQSDPKLDNTETLKVHERNDVTPSQRQKRFYGYGFPPPVLPFYPTNPKRDDGLQTGVYGEDPLVHIHRRLQDISNAVKTNLHTPPPPPPPFQYPLLVPVIYIPQIGCGCNTPQKPTPPRKNNTDDVGIENRFPEMEDERQNWGFFINETETDDGQDEDFTRPISFEPIGPQKPANRPPPPVEHGSSQAGTTPDTTTTTKKPEAANSPVETPSTCDGAVLSCCHQPQVTYDCFALQGCPDPTAYGNPCDPQVILRVIDRFQRFYGQRTG